MIVAIIVVVAIVAISVWAIQFDKKRSAIFDEETNKLFADKKVYGNDNIFITTETELVIRNHSGGVSSYKIFKLDEVKYIMSCWNPVDKIWCLGLYNEKKKNIAGEEHKSTKKTPLKAKAYFRTKSENVEFVEMLVKYIPNAELVGMSFKEYKGSYKK